MSATRCRDHEIRKVHEIAFHRNGVGGDPFYVVRFAAWMDGASYEFVATLFPACDGDGVLSWADGVRCAVLEVDLLAGGTVAFGENSWRGDRFADALLTAVRWEFDQ